MTASPTRAGQPEMLPTAAQSRTLPPLPAMMGGWQTGEERP